MKYTLTIPSMITLALFGKTKVTADTAVHVMNSLVELYGGQNYERIPNELIPRFVEKLDKAVDLSAVDNYDLVYRVLELYQSMYYGTQIFETTS